MIVESGIEEALCSSCHHDITYGKINFRVPSPPPHFRTIWDAIENFNLQYTLESKTINEKVQQVFSEVLIIIISNFVPHKFFTKIHPFH